MRIAKLKGLAQQSPSVQRRALNLHEVAANYRPLPVRAEPPPDMPGQVAMALRLYTQINPTAELTQLYEGWTFTMSYHPPFGVGPSEWHLRASVPDDQPRLAVNDEALKAVLAALRVPEGAEEEPYHWEWSDDDVSPTKAS